MEDRIYRILNGNQTLRDRIGDFKEAFVEYYGEESRKFIEKQFSKMLLIGFLSPKDENNIIKKAFENKSNEFHKRILTEAEIEYDLEDMLRVVNYDFENHPLRIYFGSNDVRRTAASGRPVGIDHCSSAARRRIGYGFACRYRRAAAVYCSGRSIAAADDCIAAQVDAGSIGL